ncbi:MAG: alpha/beta fold hydrolase [Planctomycetes bacterium]|nr:alpha/beta fold hydrolase [Planctomycetota bacterium]
MTRTMIIPALLAVMLAPSCAISADANAANELQKKVANFKTQDGVEIVGDYFPPTGRAISPVAVLLHMYRSDRSAWSPLVKPLHEAGFAVLAIDMRGHGDSTKPETLNLATRVNDRDAKLFNNMYKDVDAAIEWARKQPNTDPKKLVLIGASVGCSIAIDTMSRDKTVNAIVCMTPGTNYLGVDSTEHIAKTDTRPILLLATEDERAATDTLASSVENATGEIVGPGRAHGTRMFGVIDGIEKKIVTFVREQVNKPSTE